MKVLVTLSGHWLAILLIGFIFSCTPEDKPNPTNPTTPTDTTDTTTPTDTIPPTGGDTSLVCGGKYDFTPICTWQGLQNMFQNLNGHYILLEDIEWPQDREFYPIGGYTSAVGYTSDFFTGIFDGRGHIIKNLIINLPEKDNVGMFWKLKGEIKNVTLENISVVGRTTVGGLAAVNEKGGIITNCHLSGSVTGTSQTGGLVGNNADSTAIVEGSMSGSVTGQGNYTGGLVGESSGSVTGSSSATVTGTYATGGLVGLSSGSVTGSSSATITGTERTGGLVGLSYGSVTGSSSATITGSSTITGGLVGQNFNKKVTGYATGEILGASFSGGLVGALSGGNLTGYFLGKNSGYYSVGGLVGGNSGTVVGYVAGEVIGVWREDRQSSFIGGLVGKNDGGIDVFGYFTGKLSGPQTIGGLIGWGGKPVTGYSRGEVNNTNRASVGTGHLGSVPGHVYNIKGFHSGADGESQSNTSPLWGYSGPAMITSDTTTADDFTGFVFGTEVGNWTFITGKWPKINLGNDSIFEGLQQPIDP